MSRRAAARLGWAGVAVAAAVLLLTLAVIFDDAGADPDGDRWIMVLASVLGLVSAVVAALVLSRQPSNAIGWIFWVSVVYGGVQMPAGLLAEEAPARAAHGPALLGAWMGNWAYASGVPLAVFVLLLFPDGRLPSARWRPVAWLGALASCVYAAGVAFAPGPLAETPQIVNPLGIDDAVAGALEHVGIALSSAAFLAAIAAVVIRYRTARAVARQQIKLLAAAALFTAFVVVAAVVALLLDERVLGAALGLVSVFALPVAIAVAMLRYRLYDVDRLISRSLTYALVSVTLAAAYGGLVLAGQALFSSFAGGGDLAIAVSTLVVAALFLPLRSRVQRLVDRRFYRRRYDAGRTLEGFAARLREHVDLEALTADVRGVVDETMQPAHVSIWLRERPAR